MQAIVLAAGEGSRMRPLTKNLPKVMLPVAGKPLLEHIIVRAHAAGIEDFVLVVGYGANAVRSHFGDGSRLGVKIEYAVQEKQLGTGHALMAAESKAADRFLVLNGDVLLDVQSLKEMIAQEAAVSAIRVDDPKRYGVFLEENGYFKSVIEKSQKPPSNLANAGIYLFPRSIFDALRLAPISERGEYELTDGLNLLAVKEKLKVVLLSSWLEIGRPWDILAANEILLKEMEACVLGEVEPGATLKGRVSVGKDTKIMAGAYIEGPVIIGDNCKIGPNCYIRPYTCIGDDVRVGNAVEVKTALFSMAPRSDICLTSATASSDGAATLGPAPYAPTCGTTRPLSSHSSRAIGWIAEGVSLVRSLATQSIREFILPFTQAQSSSQGTGGFRLQC